MHAHVDIHYSTSQCAVITMNVAVLFLLVSCAFGLSAAAHIDLQSYPFSFVLHDEAGLFYVLHWNVNSETINFAVNVSTTGWVGFGVSPNGQMPGSDVVIGWVSSEGETYFHDRFAGGRFLPAIDSTSEDWTLTDSEEEDGSTILAFSRNTISCDPQDLDITTSTSRVVWSFSVSDPSDPTGADAKQHDYWGSRSLNLLGGLDLDRTTLGEELFIDVTVTNITIPPFPTVYWCASQKLSDELVNTTYYINKISPMISPHTRSYVHHVLIYICTMPLADEDVDVSVSCFDVDQFPTVGICQQSTIIGGWAVGGEDFLFPEGVGLPLGGTGEEVFVVLEMHYDNPASTSGVVDSSGLRFFYTTEEPEKKAGNLHLGHSVSSSMVIPPRTQNYTVTSICIADCTDAFLPEEGITIFANFLHTHLLGRKVSLLHYRFNSDCNVWEELEPIDTNLNYDFDYQQLVHLPREHVVLKGDALVMKCEYSSVDRTDLTLGGLSTVDEMCLTFPAFYPADGSNILNRCGSLPLDTSFGDFISYLQEIDTDAASRLNEDLNLEVLNGLDWEGNPTLATSLQDSLVRNPVLGFCRAGSSETTYMEAAPLAVSCPYQEADVCSGFEPLACCERLTEAGTFGVKALVSVILLSVVTSIMSL